MSAKIKTAPAMLAPPTTGLWMIGDIVYNAEPGPGEAIGWVCTQTGTPGIWKPFGPISL